MEQFTLTTHGILSMSNLKAIDKVALINLFTLREMGIFQSHVYTDCYRIGLTPNGYRGILKRLRDHGYVKQDKRAYWSLNQTNIY